MTLKSVPDIILGYLIISLGTYTYTYHDTHMDRSPDPSEVFLFPRRVWAFRIVNTSVITGIKKKLLLFCIYVPLH
jgi:hypothetical protein